MNPVVWFCGSGSFAARCLEVLALAFPLALVITGEPTRRGRGQKEQPSPVAITAERLTLPVVTTGDLNGDDQLLHRLETEKPHLMIVVDFGQKVGPQWLTSPEFGCLNIHPSLLPRYRGAAPVPRAIMEGCHSTGVTVFRLVEKMDAGPLWLQKERVIGQDEDASELLMTLAEEGSRLLADHLEELFQGKATFVAQDESQATYAAKIDKAEGYIGGQLSAARTACLVRGLTPSPGAWFLFKGRRVKVLAALAVEALSDVVPGCLVDVKRNIYITTPSGWLQLLAVQPEGKNRIDWAAWASGLHLKGAEPLDHYQ